MLNPAAKFRAWMNSKSLRAKDVAPRFGVSIQTIGHWRSQGVPARRQPHVNYVISCWDHPSAAQIGSSLLLQPTPEQFRRWNRAALTDHQLLEDWAIDGLDQYAGDLAHAPLKVAEPDPTKTRSAAGNE